MERPDPALVRALEGFAAGVTGLTVSYATGQLSRDDTFAALAELMETLIPEDPASDRPEPVDPALAPS